MKKVLFIILYCTVLFIGCNKASQEQVTENTNVTTETVSNEQPANQSELDDVMVNDLGTIAKEKVDNKDYKGAITDYTAALKIKPGYSWIYAQRARANSLDGNFEQAFTDADKAIELTPDQGWMYSVRADIKEAINDEKGAEQDREKAKQYGN